MGIIQDIGDGPVCLDTSIFIFFIEEKDPYISIINPIFEALHEGRLTGVTSGITLLETLVIPLRSKNMILASKYEQLLCNSKGLLYLDLDRNLLRHAAYLRASFSIKTPDAIQIATAQLHNCSAFVTNDRRLPDIAGLQILQLSDYVLGQSL